MNKRIKKISVILLALLSCCNLFVGCGATPKTVNYKFASKHSDEYALANYNFSFDIIGGQEVMPVGSFAGPTSSQKYVHQNAHVAPDFISDRYWELMVEAGLNMQFWTWSHYAAEPAEVLRSLDQAEKYNIAYFVRDQSIAGQTDIGKNIEPYINHPACVGVVGKDEPKYTEFEMLATWQKYLDENHPGKVLSVNLLPVYGGAVDGIGYSGDDANPMEYEKYLTEYMEICKIPYLAFDYYPWTEDGQTMETIPLKRYFGNLHSITKVARQYQVPAWGYFSAGYHVLTDHPYPEEAKMLWNINTMLAYGFKGLLVYNYLQVPITTGQNCALIDGQINYEHFGMVGGMGNVNAYWHYVKKATTQLQAIDHILMKSESAGVIGTGARAESLYGDTETNSVISEGAFREFKGVKKIKGKEPELVIGCLDYQGYTALYVVSNDVDKKQKVTLQFDDNYGYDVYQRGKRAGVAGKELTLTIEAGEGILVALRKD